MTTAGNDNITGTIEGDFIDGLAGDDTLSGREGADTLLGGRGDDLLLGGSGGDLYEVGLGHDTLNDQGADTDADDVVSFVGLNRDDVTLFLDTGFSLIASFEGGSVEIENPFDAADQIETLRFADGVSLSVASLALETLGTAAGDQILGTSGAESRDDTMRGGAGDDSLFGREGDDVLDGGAGDDRLEGGGGNDTYILGTGHDEIHNRDTTPGTLQTAIFENLALADVVISADRNQEVFVRWEGGSALFVDMTQAESLVERFQFTDQTLDMAQFVPELHGSNNVDAVSIPGNDVYSGQGRVLRGFDNDDTLQGNDFNDTLDGGAGDDRLFGGQGDDTYLVGLGHDFVQDTFGAGSGNDTIIVQGVNSTDVTYSRDGSTGSTGQFADVTFVWDGGSVLISGIAEVETIRFADDMAWTVRDLAYETPGTLGSDSLAGNVSPDGPVDDIFRIGAGDDFVDAGRTTRLNENDVAVFTSGADQIFMEREGDKTFAASVLGSTTVYIDGVASTEVAETLGRANNSSPYGYTQFWEGGSISIFPVDGDGPRNEDPRGLLGLTFVYADGVTRTPRLEDMFVTVTPNTIGLNGGGGNDLLTGDEQGTSPQRDQIDGREGDDTLEGGVLGDTLIGGAGDDDLYGQQGSDLLQGGTGSDDYFVTVGKSTLDLIQETADATAHTDRVFFSDVASTDLDIFRTTNGSLNIDWDDGTPNTRLLLPFVEIQSAFTADNGVEELHFSDGVIVDLETLVVETRALDHGGINGKSNGHWGNKNERLISGDYDNTLDAFDGNDTLIAGGGDDTMRGREGDDLYVVSQGRNTISDSGAETDIDSLQFDGLNRADVDLWRDRTDGQDVLRATWDTGSVVVFGMPSRSNGVERLVFADTTIDLLTGTVEQRGGTGDDSFDSAAGVNSLLFDASERLLGFAGNDAMTARGGDDTLDGGPGNDTLGGGAGADTYLLDEGHDTINEIGGLSTDGDDRAIINANLADSEIWRDEFNVFARWDGGSVFVQNGLSRDSSGANAAVEIFEFFDTTLRLADVDLEWRGTEGDDNLSDIGPGPTRFGDTSNTILGLHGDDTINGGTEADNIDGGPGRDRIFGGNDSASDTLNGGTGEDVLDGGAGDDEMFGGAGYDTLLGGAGNDTLTGGTGNDELSGGDGTDTAIFNDRFDGALYGLGSGGLNIGTSDGADFVADDIEFLQFSERTLGYEELVTIIDNLPGPPITGDSSSQTLNGTPDSEQINGLGGFDWIIPGRGNDTVDGGTERDMVSFSDIATDVPGRGGAFMVDLDLAAGTAEVFGGEVDQLTSIERATGSIFADVLRGTDGNDELRGIGDYDWFIATPGQDTLNGGNGLDMVTFLEARSSGAPVVQDIFATDGVPPTGTAVGGVLLDLADGSNNVGLAEGLTLISVERVTGSSHQDVFFGDGEQNDFRGLGGFDWFVSSTGGRERYFGGDGVDTVTYFNAGSGVIASLRNGAGEFGGQETGFGSAGDAIRDLYFEIENLVGSDFDDRLEGNRERNNLVGRDGDDYLLGYGDIDYLKGGLGNDTLDGGAGSDFALFNGNRADYTLTRTSSTEVAVVGSDGTDSLINVEYFQFDDETANIWELSIV